jgi:hypothetical protein
VQYADREFVAAVGNDGYAHPDWLAEALTPFLRDERRSHASVVFFHKNKFVLNGAGGG